MSILEKIDDWEESLVDGPLKVVPIRLARFMISSFEAAVFVPAFTAVGCLLWLLVVMALKAIIGC